MGLAAHAAGLFLISDPQNTTLDIIPIFAYLYVKRTNKEVAMKITESARAALQELLQKSPGKAVRVVFQGFG